MEVGAIAQILEKLKATDIVYYPNFFTFEGGEGSGKSTIMALLGERFAREGIKVLCTREPGGTGSGKAEAIRSLTYESEMEAMDPLTAAFLYAAARNQHVEEVVLPHLAAGYVVLCDRYVDSSLVYQGLVENNLAAVTTMNEIAIRATMPATTFFLATPPEIGLARIFAKRSNETNYLDHKALSFHQAVYDDYEILAKIFTERYVRIDATQQIAVVVDQVYDRIKQRLGLVRNEE